MQVVTVKDQLGIFVRGQLPGHVVVTVRGERARSRNHPFRFAHLRPVGIEEMNVCVRVAHQLGKIVDVDLLEIILLGFVVDDGTYVSREGRYRDYHDCADCGQNRSWFLHGESLPRRPLQEYQSSFTTRTIKLSRTG